MEEMKRWTVLTMEIIPVHSLLVSFYNLGYFRLTGINGFLNRFSRERIENIVLDV